ncbi:hypothetical protein SK128_011495 [Halocaridina rubra]|uniref:C2H2-type domain-containing protein n=1 Tax=Halocaridina rubra TaxID=373956 RepID=A0AAN8WK42_HALRR
MGVGGLGMVPGMAGLEAMHGPFGLGGGMAPYGAPGGLGAMGGGFFQPPFNALGMRDSDFLGGGDDCPLRPYIRLLPFLLLEASVLWFHYLVLAIGNSHSFGAGMLMGPHSFPAFSGILPPCLSHMHDAAFSLPVPLRERMQLYNSNHLCLRQVGEPAPSVQANSRPTARALQPHSLHKDELRNSESSQQVEKSPGTNEDDTTKQEQEFVSVDKGSGSSSEAQAGSFASLVKEMTTSHQTEAKFPPRVDGKADLQAVTVCDSQAKDSISVDGEASLVSQTGESLKSHPDSESSRLTGAGMKHHIESDFELQAGIQSTYRKGARLVAAVDSNTAAAAGLSSERQSTSSSRKIARNGKVNRCPSCDYSTLDLNEMMRHIDTHFPFPTFLCIDCLQMFRSAEELDVHYPICPCPYYNT